jgi:hypothetical protein
VNLQRDRLAALLSTRLPRQIAEALVDEFVQVRIDVVTGTLGRSSAGKFVETFVKALQHLDTGLPEKRPDIDGYLRKLDSSGANLDDGLKICASRIARSAYTLRNKRSIAHAGEVDPNGYDLAYLLHAIQWVLAEGVRVIAGSSMKEAGDLVAAISAPVGGLVDDLGGRRVVLGKLSAQQEVLVLLHHQHPEVVPVEDIKTAMKRRDESTVRKTIRNLWKDKEIEGDVGSGYQLTSSGFRRATKIVVASQFG